MQQIPEAKTKPARGQREGNKRGTNQYHNDRRNDRCPYDLKLAKRQLYSGGIGKNRIPQILFRPLRHLQNVFHIGTLQVLTRFLATDPVVMLPITFFEESHEG